MLWLLFKAPQSAFLFPKNSACCGAFSFTASVRLFVCVCVCSLFEKTPFHLVERFFALAVWSCLCLLYFGAFCLVPFHTKICVILFIVCDRVCVLCVLNICVNSFFHCVIMFVSSGTFFLVSFHTKSVQFFLHCVVMFVSLLLCFVPHNICVILSFTIWSSLYTLHSDAFNVVFMSVLLNALSAFCAL